MTAGSLDGGPPGILPEGLSVPAGAIEGALLAAGAWIPATVEGPGPIAGLVAVVIGLLLIDLLLFARGREPGFKEAGAWSVGWFALSLAVVVPIMALDSTEAGIEYTTVYLIERTLSLDNLFVFLVIFGYFMVPLAQRAKLLFWGIVLALAMRGAAILAGVELLERFDWLIYILGGLLIVLAYRLLKGDHAESDPGNSVVVRTVRRVAPTASAGVLALVALAFADVTFAIDSIPAAFAITDDSFVIWAANAFALMGMRALFVLVEGLIARFRYLDETLAVVLALVGVKLLIEDLVHTGPVVSLMIVLVAFAIGIGLSLRVERREKTPSAA